MLAFSNRNLQLHRCSPFSSLQPKMSSSSSSLSTVKIPKSRKLKSIDATPLTFAEFGQVISASPDGQEFGPHDARLDLHRGIPRFYIMHIEDREFKFTNMTHHASVSQCLGSANGGEWFLGVAKCSIIDKGKIGDDGLKRTVVRSKCGHYYVPPHPDDVYIFRIVGAKFLKLNVGTWHAGPLFKVKAMDFYNLELSNTNVVDHTTHDFLKEDEVVFLVED